MLKDKIREDVYNFLQSERYNLAIAQRGFIPLFTIIDYMQLHEPTRQHKWWIGNEMRLRGFTGRQRMVNGDRIMVFYPSPKGIRE